MRAHWGFCSVLLAACSTAPDGIDSSNDASLPDTTSLDGNDGDAAPDTVSADTATMACQPGTATGMSGDNEMTNSGENVLVRTPAGYDPTVASPLIVVYAACCVSGPLMETFTGLTAPATERGYVIAYVDHISPTNQAAVIDAASAITAVEETFCIDWNHVYLTGHSDGGSLTDLIALTGAAQVTATAPSASGVRESILTTATCPTTPVPVFDMHSSGDTLFPVSEGFGADVAAWWAMCDGCVGAQTPLADGCIPYGGCTGGAQVIYCQGTAVHGIWPGLDTEMLDFFDHYRM